MKIDVIFSTGMESDLTEQTVVVIDVLRATSTILTALTNGCQEVIPVSEPEDAFLLAKRGEKGKVLIGGERNGVMVPGFNLGNSPLDYTKEAVKGKRIILCTTNGTKALSEAAGKGAGEILIGSFLNITRVASYLKETERDITLFCAGREGKLSLEDLFCAGKIIKKILFMKKCRTVPELTDAGRVALITYRYLANKGQGPIIALTQTEHGQFLSSIGFHEDLRFCGQVDALPQLAVYKNGSVLLKQ